MPLASVIPALLLSLPLAAALLLYVYRRGGTGSEVRVASVLLLKKISRPVFAPRKIRLPPRFFLELLIAALLACAAAGLFLQGEGGLHVVLIDNSLSMGAQSTVGSQSERRLDRAKTEAEKTLSTLPLGAQVSVFITSPGLSNVSGGYVSVAEARKLISAVGVSYASDNLRPALERLLASNEGTPITVLTDQRVRTNPESALLSTPTSIGTPLTNVAISSLRLREGARKDVVSVVASIDAFVPDSSRTSTDGIPLLVTLEELSIEQGAYRSLSVGARTEKKQIIKHGERLETRFDDVPRSGQAFRIRVTGVSAGTASESNALREDDEAYFLPRATKGSLLVVSDLSANQLGLTALKSYPSKAVSPESFNPASLESATPLVVLHRFDPRELPPVPLLVILPPLSSPHFPSKAEKSPGQVTRWLEGHPLNSYVQYSSLALKEQSVLQVPGWAQEVASSTHGPLLYAGELEGRRVVVSGLELLPFEGKKSPLLSILTLNILKWLSGDTSDTPFSSVFSRIALPVGTAQVRMFPDSPLKDLEDLKTALPEEPGVLISFDAKGVLQIREAINFFDTAESDTATTPALEVSVPSRAKAESSSQSLVKPLSIAALILLLVDSLIWMLRRYRARSHAV